MDAQIYAKGGLDASGMLLRCADARCLGLWIHTPDWHPINTNTLLNNVARLNLKNGLLPGGGQCNGYLKLVAVGIGADGFPATLPIVFDYQPFQAVWSIKVQISRNHLFTNLLFSEKVISLSIGLIGKHSVHTPSHHPRKPVFTNSFFSEDKISLP